MSPLLAALLACAPGPGSTPGTDTGASDPLDGGADGGTDGGADTGPDVQVDVLVIGGGPAGLAAAWEAQQAGATVLVVEREEALGGSGSYARHFLAAGTSQQLELGIEDSPEALLLDWVAISGGDPEDAWVQAFAQAAGDTVQWLADLGVPVVAVVDDKVCGSVPRIHVLDPGDAMGPVGPLVTALQELAWTEAEATALRVDPEAPDRVAGAWVEDLRTGESLEVAARTTVVATGGFGRDPSRVEASRPELAGMTWVYEAGMSSDGGGHALLEALPVGWHGEDQLGLYVHSAANPLKEGDALILKEVAAGVIVDATGRRVANEEEALGFGLQQHLMAAPDHRLWVVLPDGIFQMGGAWSFSQMLAGGGGPEVHYTPGDLLDMGVAVSAPDAVALGAALGIDGDGLQATLVRYDDLAREGEDVDFGREAESLVPFGGQPLVAMELVAGSAKAFGGASLDLSGRVLDVDGQPVPGLYAAGEVAGMLGSPGVGRGFSGSITGVYLTGRTAGAAAAAEAQTATGARKQAAQ